VATGRGKYGKEDKTVREHSECIVAVHKETGLMFGGKAAGTHIGYSKMGALKNALNLAKKDYRDYRYVKLSFNGTAGIGIPEITLLDE
jgi:hypothetical protein